MGTRCVLSSGASRGAHGSRPARPGGRHPTPCPPRGAAQARDPPSLLIAPEPQSGHGRRGHRCPEPQLCRSSGSARPPRGASPGGGADAGSAEGGSAAPPPPGPAPPTPSGATRWPGPSPPPAPATPPRRPASSPSRPAPVSLFPEPPGGTGQSGFVEKRVGTWAGQGPARGGTVAPPGGAVSRAPRAQVLLPSPCPALPGPARRSLLSPAWKPGKPWEAGGRPQPDRLPPRTRSRSPRAGTPVAPPREDRDLCWRGPQRAGGSPCPAGPRPRARVPAAPAAARSPPRWPHWRALDTPETGRAERRASWGFFLRSSGRSTRGQSVNTGQKEEAAAGSARLRGGVEHSPRPAGLGAETLRGPASSPGRRPLRSPPPCPGWWLPGQPGPHAHRRPARLMRAGV